jgi:hypothetical protein
MRSDTSPRLSARQWSLIAWAFAIFLACRASHGGVASIPGPLPQIDRPTALGAFPELQSSSAVPDQNAGAKPQDVLFGQDPSADIDLINSGAYASSTAALPSNQIDKADGQDGSPNGPPASAIPIPAALQSGLSGMAALALAGFCRRIRRALRS